MKNFFVSISPFHHQAQDKEFTVTGRRLFGSKAVMKDTSVSHLHKHSLSLTNSQSHKATKEKRATPEPGQDGSDDEETTPKSKNQPKTTSTPPVKRVGFAEPPPRFQIDNTDQTPLLAQQHGSIDEDFDFSYRKNRSLSNRLRKRASQPSMHRRTLSVASDQQALLAPSRSSSAASSNSSRSLSKRLGSLLGPSRRASSTPKTPPASTNVCSDFSTPPIPAQLPNTLLEDLPADKPLLSGRINYHISQLERYKRDLKIENSRIINLMQEQALWEGQKLAQEMPVPRILLEQRLATARAVRNGLRPMIWWHRGELEQIAKKRMELDAAIGVEGRVPAVYSGLTSEEGWNQYFLV